MNKFVKECRREWKRLRVADAAANEMAADLTADIQEAEAEGASIEDVLGNSAFDPRSFARAWAAERGVSRPPAVTEPASRSRRWLAVAAIAATAVALVGVLMLSAPQPHRSIAYSASGGRALVVPPSFRAPPPGFAAHARTVADQVHALGLLVLIVGIVAIVATLVSVRRTRAGDGSGWNPPSPA